MSESVVACFKTGKKYGPEYVNRLYSMVWRHTSEVHRFLCFSESPHGLGREIEWRLLPGNPELEGWWYKLWLFSGVFRERVVFLDLDVVILDSIDFLFEYDGPFCILKDFWQNSYNSSVMSIAPGAHPHVWEKFIEHPRLYKSHFYGDQEWISDQVQNADIWQDLYPGKIKSYKADSLESGAKGAAIAVFHGLPKMADLPHDHWARQAWGTP